ncbi:MAG: hypothetical protein KC477_12315, partial [Oceanospirillaceae bacterium]|nr:hypothetical protein [Oceanospirillaceae bacterium]
RDLFAPSKALSPPFVFLEMHSQIRIDLDPLGLAQRVFLCLKKTAIKHNPNTPQYPAFEIHLIIHKRS